MKIGIATVHDSANIGSYLQAYAMQEIVRAHGDEPYIIRTRSTLTSFLLHLGYNNSKGARSLRSFAKFVIKLIKNPTGVVNGCKRFRMYKKDWIKFDKIISVRQANKLGLDALILGSDEIWNSNQPAFRNPLLYGDGIEARKKYAFAISAGSMNEDNWTKYPRLLSAIKRLDAIAVRDNRTYGLLRHNGVKIFKSVCDPTLQTDIRAHMSDGLSTKIPGAYIAVYAYAVSDNIREHILRFARENNLRTVAVSLYQPWCDDYVNCSPLEFGTVLKNADYVYTATFHGTIFSILYHTRFVSVSALPKVAEVLTLAGAESAALNETCSYEEFSAKLGDGPDYAVIEERLKAEAAHGYEVYEKMIKEKL